MNNSASLPLVVGSLLFMLFVSGGVVAEAENNYMTVAQSEDSTGEITGVTQRQDGLLFEVEVENRLNRPIRIDYVRLNITKESRSVIVSVPFGERISIDPGINRIDVFVSARRYERLSPVENKLTIEGYVVGLMFNNHRTRIDLESSKITI
jgi:hypothetical protein